MALRDTLEAVLREYDSAKLTTFAGNPLAVFIRKEALGLRLGQCRLRRCLDSTYKRRNRRQHLSSMPERNADILEVLIGEMAKHRYINLVLGKALRVLGHAEFFKPLHNLRQCGTPPTHFAVLAGKDT
jgi:hypothetical protein